MGYNQETWRRERDSNQGKLKKFQGGMKGLKEHTFYYGPGVD